jgi:hypothetical protein
MKAIEDFVTAGGWKIDVSNSKKIRVDDVIFVVPGEEADTAGVRVVRAGADMASGEGWLTHVGSLYVAIEELALTLAISGGRLFFNWDDGSGGPSPDGGGSSGGPGGHP